MTEVLPASEQPTAAMSAEVRPITLDAAGVSLSGLLAEPERSAPRATVVALHGGGMSAGYFDGQAHPDLSLLALGARLGFTVLALDRPGYGHSAARLPDGQTLAEQAVTVSSAIMEFGERCPTGAGVLLVGHSYGGKLALHLAADGSLESLLAVDVAGIGHRFAVDPGSLAQLHGVRQRRLNWGPLTLYPPGTFLASGRVVAPMPRREAEGVRDWPRLSDTLLPRVGVPVRLTFAEHEAWWRTTDDDLADLAGRFTAAPRVLVERLSGAGHNISLGWAARAYHLRVLAHLEETLTPPRRLHSGGAV